MFSPPFIEPDRLVAALRKDLPELIAVHAFGSQVGGAANAESDLDLAVLVETYVEPVVLWDLAQSLAGIAGCPVDLIDLRAASTVMQYQIITTGKRWWKRDSAAALYEAAILSEKTALDHARAPLLADIGARGSVHGR